jgi:hypothetical protein
MFESGYLQGYMFKGAAQPGLQQYVQPLSPAEFPPPYTGAKKKSGPLAALKTIKKRMKGTQGFLGEDAATQPAQGNVLRYEPHQRGKQGILEILKQSIPDHPALKDL